MSYWLYQMSSEYWSSALYRVEVWEAEHTNWPIGRKVPKDSSPQPGDIMILYYAPTTEPDSGIYGWATIIRADEEEVRFIPSPPSDYMKMNPVWDQEVKELIVQIQRGMPRGTLWRIEDNLFKRLRQKIAEHVYGVSS